MKNIFTIIFIYFRIRLISVASQKFIADIANEALQHTKLRLAKYGKLRKDGDFHLTLDSLRPVLRNRGINIRKPPYFV